MNYIIFDAHCDTVNVIFTDKTSLDDNTGMINTDMLKKYDGYIQVFATWVSAKKPDHPLVQAIARADKFYEETEKSGFTVIKDSQTLNSVAKNGGLGAILALEDGLALSGNIRILNMLSRIGYRAVTLTWNGQNELGDGAVDSSGRGLTDFGKEAVKRMNELKMAIDVSHLSRRGFWDVIEISEKPIIASHSNAKAVCDHPRNLNDEQIKATIKNGGAIGINLYTDFLNGTEKAGVSDVLSHIEHMLALGAEENIGIGTDFDGISRAADGLENAGRLYKLFDEMKKIGYSDELIEKISHKNFVRVFGEIFV